MTSTKLWALLTCSMIAPMVLTAQLRVIAIGARLFASLGPAVGTLPVGACWSDTTLDLAFVPSGSAMLDVFGGTRTIANGNVLPLADAFADFPVALIQFRNAEA